MDIMESERMKKKIPFRPVKITSNECKFPDFGLFPRAAAECRKETIMNKMYDAVMKMETLNFIHIMITLKYIKMENHSLYYIKI